jgi:hypothetical protein
MNDENVLTGIDLLGHFRIPGGIAVHKCEKR